MPQGVRDVIARRVARLPEHAGQVLRVAALIGRDFEFDAARARGRLAGGRAARRARRGGARGALLVEVAERARPLLVRPRAAAHDAWRPSSRRRGARAAPPDRRGDRAAPPRPARPVARRARAPLRRRRAGRGRPRRRLRRARRRAGDGAARLRRGGAAPRRGAVALRRADDPVDEAELARLELGAGHRARPTPAAGRRRARASRAPPTAARAAGRRPRVRARRARPRRAARWEHYGTEDAASIALLEEALERLPEGDSRAARAGARPPRRAPATSWPTCPRSACWSTADAAVAMARRLGDPDALVAALTAAQYARWRPGRAADRLPIARRADRVGRGAGRAGRRGRGPPVARGRPARALPARRGRRAPRAARRDGRGDAAVRSSWSTATRCARCARCWKATTSAARRPRRP